MAASERYQPLEKHVTVEASVVTEVGQVTLKVLKGKATVNLATAVGANASTWSAVATGASFESLPLISVEHRHDEDLVRLQASKTGYSDSTAGHPRSTTGRRRRASR